MQIKYFKVLYQVPHGNFAIFGGRLTNPKESWSQWVSEETGKPVAPEYDIYEATLTSLIEVNKLVDYCSKNNFLVEITELGASKFKLIPHNRNCPCNFIQKEDQ